MRLIDADALIEDVRTWVAIDGREEHLKADVIEWLKEFPSAQPNTTTNDSIPAETGKNDGDRTSGDCISRAQATCEYCHEDSDGYVLSIEKNGHAYIQNGKLALRANGWRGECRIEYCPMCGRKLRGEQE